MITLGPAMNWQLIHPIAFELGSSIPWLWKRYSCQGKKEHFVVSHPPPPSPGLSPLSDHLNCLVWLLFMNRADRGRELHQHLTEITVCLDCYCLCCPLWCVLVTSWPAHPYKRGPDLNASLIGLNKGLKKSVQISDKMSTNLLVVSDDSRSKENCVFFCSDRNVLF